MAELGWSRLRPEVLSAAPRLSLSAYARSDASGGGVPASTKDGVGSDLRSSRQRLAQHTGRGVADSPPPRHARHPRMESPLGRACRALVGAPDLGRRLRNAGAHRSRDGGLRRGVRALPHRLDHPQRGLSLQPDGRDRPVRDRQAIRRAPVRRSAGAGAPHRVLVRRLHRGRGRVRHARGDHGGAPHGPGLHAALRSRPVAHRQHRAGGLWCHRHADSDPGGGHRHLHRSR